MPEVRDRFIQLAWLQIISAREKQLLHLNYDSRSFLNLREKKE